jgi:hypothetical protein
LLLALAAAPAMLRGGTPSQTLRGVLSTGARPALKTPRGPILLNGDEPTDLVLHDQRLDGADFEVAGEPKAENDFAVGPIHTRSLFVYRGGKRLAVSYWCDICYIRTWSPGKCWCCQEETRLDPVDPATLDDTNAKSKSSGA